MWSFIELRALQKSQEFMMFSSFISSFFHIPKRQSKVTDNSKTITDAVNKLDNNCDDDNGNDDDDDDNNGDDDVVGDDDDNDIAIRASDDESTTLLSGSTIPRKKKTRTVFSRQQVSRLEMTFDMKRYLSSQERAYLASTLRLSETQVTEI